MKHIDYAPPSPSTHFLVTGGGKGITAETAVALAEAFQSRFTLVGRSALLEEDPAWSKSLEDPAVLKQAALDHFQAQGQKLTPREIDREVNRILSSREITQTLSRISRAGGSGEYIQADVTSANDLQSKLNGRITSINALLHGAGALADKYIEDKTEADFDLVYGVKIGGLKNLLDLIPPQQLEYLVLFSSVAGFYGNAGQADYSLSNEILNKIAFHLKRAQPACQVLSINWGPWDGGMVTAQLKRILTRRNISLIPLREGSQALVDLLSSPQENPQRVIGTPLPIPPRKLDPDLKSYRILRHLDYESNPFLADHVIGGKPVLPTVCAVSWFINACSALYPEYRFHGVSDYRVFKGIVFDGPAGEDYVLELREILKTADRLLFAGRISSYSADKPRYHYQAEIELVKSLPARPLIREFDLTDTAGITGNALYSAGTLFHGPGFQGIQQVLNITPEGMTTRCALPNMPADYMGQFPINQFNPLLADVHLQSLLIWAHHNLGSVGLPLQIASGIQYEMPPEGAESYVTMRATAATAHKLVADVISHDPDGQIYTKVTGAEITLNKGLYGLFQHNQPERTPA